MNAVYYGCDWQMQFIGFSTLTHISKTLTEIDPDAQIVLAGRKSETGIMVGTFIIKAVSKLTVNDFVLRAGMQLKLRDWYPTTQQEFDRGISLHTHKGKSDVVQTTWTFGKYNATLRKQARR